METQKAKKPKAQAKTAAPAAAKPTSKTPSRSAAKTAVKAAPKPTVKTPAKSAAIKGAPKKNSASQEQMLARVEAVRLSQREGGYFDCFGRAVNGYCDQGGCMYHAECLSVSQLVHSL